MRPVNKGQSPYESIDKYADALPYLEERLGLYCSYCEFPISHVPEVEHISSKSKGGALTDWDNLLLGCKYCNSRKGSKVTPENRDKYLWPDIDNTALAYTYYDGVPNVNESDLNLIDPTGVRLEKAKNLFNLVDLSHIPIPNEKDRRFSERNKAYELAIESLNDWKSVKNDPDKYVEMMKSHIKKIAQLQGFFSVWMTVFADEPEIMNAIIEAFPATNRLYYDEQCHPKKI